MRRSVYSESMPCPPERVWAFVADLRNDSVWRREITDVEVVAGTPPWAASYRESINWLGSRAQADLTVSESVRGERVVVLADGPGFSSRSAWTFEPNAEGAIVTLSFSLETSGALRVTESLLWEIVEGWLRRDLPMLEGHLTCVVETR